MNSPRITARIYRDENGETHKEYKVDDITVGSIERLQNALKGR